MSQYNLGQSLNASAGSSVLGSATTNCIVPYSYYPSYQYVYTPPADLSVRKVRNGFILNQGQCETVFESVESLCKWITEKYQETK